MVATKTKPAAATPADSPTVEPKIKLNPRSIQVGDIVACVQYLKVKQVNQGGLDLLLGDMADPKHQIQASGEKLITSLYSADRYEKEEKLTMTALAEKMVGLYNRPFTVQFKKADGTLRTLRGQLVQPEPLLGRSHVLDFDVPAGEHPLRLIDHRTIELIIVDGVKYSKK